MVANALPDNLLNQLSELVAEKLGLNFPRERWNDLARGVKVLFHPSSVNDLKSSVEYLLTSGPSKKQLETLASHLTIGETYFFRDKNFFDVLEKNLLTNLIDSRRGKDQYIRIWSAGCCTGEEPYSIAILLSRLIHDLDNWNITLLASDINPNFLQKMSHGIYNDWSFRDCPQEIKQKFFKRTYDNRYEILGRLKKIVTPSYLNLADDSYPSLFNNTNAMDLIICRNVLMYFTHEKFKEVVNRFRRSLVDGGCLIVSPSETSLSLFTQFKTVNYPGTIFYQKIENDSSSNLAAQEIPHTIISETVEEKLIGGNFETEEPAQISEPCFQINIDTKPGDYHSIYNDAQQLFEQGNYLESKKKLEEYIGFCYDDPKAHALLANNFANLGMLREAFAWCEKATSLEKTNCSYHYLMATILQEQEKYDAAIISLKRSVYLDRDFIPAHIALGNIFAKLDMYEESQKSFRNALMLLQNCKPEVILPETNGMTAERLIEVIQANNLVGTEL